MPATVKDSTGKSFVVNDQGVWVKGPTKRALEAVKLNDKATRNFLGITFGSPADPDPVRTALDFFIMTFGGSVTANSSPKQERFLRRRIY